MKIRVNVWQFVCNENINPAADSRLSSLFSHFWRATPPCFHVPGSFYYIKCRVPSRCCPGMKSFTGNYTMSMKRDEEDNGVFQSELRRKEFRWFTLWNANIYNDFVKPCAIKAIQHQRKDGEIVFAKQLLDSSQAIVGFESLQGINTVKWNNTLCWFQGFTY